MNTDPMNVTPELYEQLLTSARKGIVGDPWGAGKELVDLRLEIIRLRTAVRQAIRRNELIWDDKNFVGKWIALPSDVFDQLAALAGGEAIIGCGKEART